MTAEQNKLLIQRLVEEAVNPSNLEVLDEVAKGDFARPHATGSGPSATPSPTSPWRSWTWVADDEKVAAHFRCSGTHLGEWMGRPPTGQRFQDDVTVSAWTPADLAAEIRRKTSVR